MVEAARAMQNGGPAIGTTQPHIPHADISSFEGVVPKTRTGARSAAGASSRASGSRGVDDCRRTIENKSSGRMNDEGKNDAGLLARRDLRCSAARRRRRTRSSSPIGQRGNWDTSVSEIGQRAGIFKKHGLTLEIVYTQGAGETQQAVISGSVDIGVAAGMMGVLSAYSKGAPVRVIGAETTGAGDLYWYVKADSPIKTLKDTDGKTMAYSTNGSSTHGIVTAFMKQYDLKAKPTATGGPPGTLTQVMSGPDRCRLGGAAVRARSARQEGNPHHRHRQRRRGVQGPDRAAQHRQRADSSQTKRMSSTAT